MATLPYTQAPNDLKTLFWLGFLCGLMGSIVLIMVAEWFGRKF